MKYDTEPQQRKFDDEGISYLESRYLTAETAISMRISAYGGNVYFPFFKNGQIVAYKVRNIHNKKEQRSINVALSKDEEKAEWPFFNQLQPNNTKYLIITEGEFDAMAFIQLGAENVASLPHGSGSVEKTFKTNYKYLQQFETIYIAFDMDEAGKKAAEKASKLIPSHKYKRIHFPDECKDANDWLIKDLPGPDDVARLMNNAQMIYTPDIVPLYDLRERIIKGIDLGESFGYRSLDNILGGLRRGELTVITADTGCGKTTFCMNLVKNVAERGNAIWVNSYEMDPAIVGRKIACVVLGKHLKYRDFSEQEDSQFTMWMFKNPVHINPLGRGCSVKELRNSVEMAAFAYGIRFIFIDHLDYIKSHGDKQSVLENIDEAMRELHQIALEFKVSIILVVHPKQIEGKRELTIHDLKGSSAIKQYADNIIIMTRTDNLDPTQKGMVKFDIVKNRLLGRQQFFSMKYHEESDSYSEVTQ